MIGQHYYTRCGAEAGCGGFDGFQTRAKSRSIAKEIDEAIQLYAASYVWPHSLSRLAAKTRDLTREEFQSTPVSMHFYPITKNRWGLTRVRQHPQQSGRGGNFFAHTLVLPLWALGAADFNPFSILRSGVFKDSEGTARKELPELSVREILGGAEVRSPSSTVSGAAEVFRALVVKPGERRPVVLLAGGWEENAAIIENALLLLPPEYRPSVAFSTYEPNPYRLLGAAGRKAASQIVIGTIPREEGGRFEFRDEEYKASYHVVNVLVGRTSQPEPASPEYVALAEAALKGDEQQAARLADVQQEISDRHLSASPEKWDSALAPGLAPPRPARAVRRPLQTALAGALIVMAAAGGFWVGGRTPVETQRQLASARKEIAQLRQSPATPTAELEFAQRLQQALQIGGVKPRVEDAVVLAEFEAGLFGEGTEVSAKGNAVLAEVRKTLSPLQEQLIVEVEGHTDSRTVRKGAAWTDNYMLGYLRARVVEDGLRAGDGLSKAQFRRSSVGPDSPVLGSRPADAVNRSVLLRLQKKR